eukprot:TRINITY_DN8117_c0_g1_i1.p1 TRINITY_DN8117_c0_g1~~TRINITY_DN8117_c0_g1_i1.p1  ORF type:complete len:626 (-),score=106.84 TRINITY_DN8117_c0_g1_i1:319-2196(-)
MEPSSPVKEAPKEVGIGSVGSSTLSLLTVDDSQSPVDVFRLYCESELQYRRLCAAKNLKVLFCEMSVQDFVQITFPLVQRLKGDSAQEIRLQTLISLEKIFQSFLQKEPGQTDPMVQQLLQQIAQCSLDLMVDPAQEVRAQASTILSQAIKAVGADFFFHAILLPLKNVYLGSSNEDIRITIIECIGQSALLSPPDMVSMALFPVIKDLESASSTRTTQAILSVLPKLGSNSNADLREGILLPAYLQASKSSSYKIRQTCGQQFYDFAKLFTPVFCTSTFTPIMMALARDSNAFVRNSLSPSIGPYITHMDKETLDPQLLQLFTSLAEAASRQGGDIDGIHHCSYSLAAVLEKHGPELWGHLRHVFGLICRSKKPYEILPLSASLWKIASVIGPGQSKADLLDVFSSFLRGEEAIKKSAFRTFSDFIACLEEEQRSVMFHQLGQIVLESTKNWRLRKIISKQIPKMCQTLSGSHLIQFVVPLYLEFSKDPVGKVRQVTNSQSLSVMEAVWSKSSEHFELLVAALVDFSKSPNYNQRLSFLGICFHVVPTMDPTMFSKYFLGAVIALSQDKVPNVRLKCVDVFTKMLAISALHKPASDTLSILLNDSDRGVSSEVRRLAESFGNKA